MKPAPTEAAQAFAHRRRQAQLLLLLAMLLFVASLLWAKYWPAQAFYAGALKAFAEAAMVGGLADWFAVSALFRRIPIPFLSGHTDVLRRNQSRVAHNLALFVRQHFFSPEAISQLLRQHDLPLLLARWLRQKRNRQNLAAHLQTALQGALHSWDDAPIRRLIQNGLQDALRQAELRPAIARSLALFTHEGRHQELLDALITRLAAYLAKEETHGRFAHLLADYLREEYPVWEKMLPTQAISGKGANIVQDIMQSFFYKIQSQPDHFVRQEVNDWVAQSLQRIEHDRAWAERIHAMQAYAADNPEFQRFAASIWEDIRHWLLQDLAQPNSQLHRLSQSLGLWLAQTLLRDADLRRSLQNRLEAAAQSMAPELGQFLEGHIASTLAGWDSALMVQEIETQVGKDLQGIRINGTLLGGAIGLLLWGLAQLVNLL